VPRREQPTPTSFHSCAERLIIIPLRLYLIYLLSLSYNCSLDLHRHFHASIRLLRTVHGSIVPASPVLSYFGCYRRRPTLSEPTGIFCPSGYIHPPALLTTFTKQPQQFSWSTVVLSTIAHSSSFALHNISLQHSSQALTASSHVQRNRLLLSLIQPRSPTHQLAYVRISIATPVG